MTDCTPRLTGCVHQDKLPDPALSYTMHPVQSARGTCTVGKLQLDKPDFAETIHFNYPPDMNTQRESFYHGRHYIHRQASMAEEPYVRLHPSEVIGGVRFVSWSALPQVDAGSYARPSQVYAADPRYDVHSSGASYGTKDGLGLVGNEMLEVSFGCVPQSACVPLPRREYLDPNGGYPCGHLVCPPTSRPTTSNVTNWMYPNATPPPYSYHSNLYIPPSFCQMVYPPPLFFGVIQPRVPAPMNEELRHRAASILPRSDRRNLPSFASASNERATKSPQHRCHSGTPKEHSGRRLDGAAPTRRIQSTDVVPTHSKISCVNDRVLTKFKTTKGEQLKIKDILGHLLAFCLDQAGSRFIQEQLAQSTQHEADIVHEELAPHALTLMRDVFGNYIIQILLQNGSLRYRHALARVCKENTMSLTLHVYGCRVIQKALEVLDFQLRTEIVQNLDTHVIRCIKDMNGNHVVQKSIREFDLEDIPFVTRAVHDRLVPFSTHPYGCRVVQRVLEKESKSREQERMREKIMETIVENMAGLSQDIYGNYVAQHLLRYSNASLRRRAIECLMTAPIAYACHKYASNVLEQALVCSDTDDKLSIIKTIINAPLRGDGGDSLCLLTTNRYGNYVVQKMLDVAGDEMRYVIVRTIGERMKSLKKLKFGKHIVARVESMMSQPPEREAHSEEEYSVSSVA